MKSLVPSLAIWFAALAASSAQTTVSLDSFESPAFATGSLNGQGGWTTVNVSGTVAYAVVSNFAAYSGSQSAYLVDNDPTNNPKAWREPTGANISNGRFDFAVKESPYTSGRDYWTVVFSNVGSSTANFKLSLSSASVLTLYGGTAGTTVLATGSATSPGWTYSATDWNTFSVVFNEGANTASVYLNGGATPILASSDTATNWAAGRFLVCSGASTYTDMGVFFDQSAPEWETTEKLRYAPKTVVAPTLWAPPKGFATKTFPDDEDVIVQISSTQTRTGNLGVVGGRSVRIIGGDLGATYLATTAQTKSVFIEGLKINQSLGLTSTNGVVVEMKGTKTTGCREMDGMDVCGTTSAMKADVFVQNCSIKGVHGTAFAHGPAVPVQSIVCTGTGPGGSFNATITLSSAVTLETGTNWLIVGATTEPKLNGTYKIVLGAPITTAVIGAVRWDGFNAMPPAPFGPGTSGTGGYLWAPNPSGSDLHADGYQSMAEGIYNVAHFYRVSIDSNAECFLGLNQHNTQGMKGLVMTRVNMAVNNIWPQNYDSACLYIGTTDQSGGGWGSNGMPVSLDRVYIKPRPQRELVRAVYPGVSTTRGGVNVSAESTDGDVTAHWPAIMGVTGHVTKSATGFPGEAGFDNRDYADLDGPNAPGLNYVSPGYSSGAVQPLSITGITGNPVISGTVTVPVSSATGTVVTRLDVNFTGDGHIIDLSLGDSSGKFGMDAANKRNVIVKAPLTVGTYTVTGTASQNGNPANKVTQTFSIRVQ